MNDHITGKTRVKARNRSWYGRCASVLSILFISLWMTGCDGGIFGTGSGDLNTDIDATGGGMSPSESTDPSTSVNQPVDADFDDSISFTNADSGSSLQQPLLRVVNVSRLPIRFTLTGSSAFSADLAPTSSSNYLPAADGDSTLDVQRPDDSENTVLLSIAPLSLGAGSVSTVVITEGAENADTAIDAIPLSTQTRSTDNALALVRVVLAVNSDERVATQLSLQPAADNPAPSIDVFASLSADQLFSDYQLITAGDYLLETDQSSMPALSVSVQAGEVYTWVLYGSNESPQLLAVTDSQGVPENP